MKPIKASTLVTIAVAFIAAAALIKWVLLPILNAADPSGTGATVLLCTVPPIAIVWALIVLMKDSKGEEKAEQSEDN